MKRIKLGRALAIGIVVIAVLSTLSALSMPVPAWKQPLLLIGALLVLLLVHAASYEFGDRIRYRFGLGVYAGVQAALLFVIVLARPATPLALVLFMVGIAELVTLGGGSAWGTVRITVGAVALFVLASFFTADLYRATSAGLILGATGLLAHAIAGLLQRGREVATVAVTASVANGLSERETEVLRELVAGARNNEIAEKLNISERTVKAHLGSIYQKLGVPSRAAAVATAVKQRLV